jgi:hypothetical protein
MTSSKNRRDAVLGDARHVDVPLRRSTTIATSTVQNDAGVFEFGSRDERYMPFEGAGAISAWRVSLPANFRSFDYQTITDLIVHIAYTADCDETFKTAVEEANAALEGTIARAPANVPPSRSFSLRQDFCSAFTRPVHSPAGTEVRIEITPHHLPLFLQGRTLQINASGDLGPYAPQAGVLDDRLVDESLLESDCRCIRPMPRRMLRRMLAPAALHVDHPGRRRHALGQRTEAGLPDRLAGGGAARAVVGDHADMVA